MSSWFVSEGRTLTAWHLARPSGWDFRVQLHLTHQAESFPWDPDPNLGTSMRAKLCEMSSTKPSMAEASGSRNLAEADSKDETHNVKGESSDP